MSKEAIAALLWLASSVFTVVGGVGGGLYMAYFACVGVVVIVMVYFFDAFYTTTGLTHKWGFAIDDRPVIESVCEMLQCVRTYSDYDHLDDSALTFLSATAAIAAIACLLCRSSRATSSLKV